MSEQQTRTDKNQVFRQGDASGIASSGGMPTMSVADRLKQEFGIEVAQQNVRLPSGGKIYPSDSGLYMRDSIDIKAMTTKEEDILTSKALFKKGTIVTELIKACVIDKSVDINQLIAGDRNALMVAIRVTGYGEKYEPSITCPNGDCGANVTATFDLSKLPLKMLEAEPIAPGVNEFGFTLPHMKANVTFKLLTGKDEEELLAQQEQRKRLKLQRHTADGSVVDTLISDQLKASILSVNGKRDKTALAFFVENMNGRDSVALRDYMGKIQPGVEMSQEFTCTECGHKEEVTVPITVSFLWPFVK